MFPIRENSYGPCKHTIGDVLARYNHFKVICSTSMGWDSFGMPEKCSKTKYLNPKTWMKKILRQ